MRLVVQSAVPEDNLLLVLNSLDDKMRCWHVFSFDRQRGAVLFKPTGKGYAIYTSCQ
jgi:hypothetical protein